MRYYRHDLDLSDHHSALAPTVFLGAPVKGMQGRLFLYMHQQMLARYDTDRFAVELPAVVPFLQWDKPNSWCLA